MKLSPESTETHIHKNVDSTAPFCVERAFKMEMGERLICDIVF